MSWHVYHSLPGQLGPAEPACFTMWRGARDYALEMLDDLVDLDLGKSLAARDSLAVLPEGHQWVGYVGMVQYELYEINCDCHDDDHDY